MAARTDGTKTRATVDGNSRGRSASTATAPARTASSAKSCPSSLVPGTQKKRDPGPASAERYVRPETETAVSPLTSASGRAAASSRRGTLGVKGESWAPAAPSSGDSSTRYTAAPRRGGLAVSAAVQPAGAPGRTA